MKPAGAWRRFERCSTRPTHSWRSFPSGSAIRSSRSSPSRSTWRTSSTPNSPMRIAAPSRTAKANSPPPTRIWRPPGSSATTAASSSTSTTASCRTAAGTECSPRRRSRLRSCRCTRPEHRRCASTVRDWASPCGVRAPPPRAHSNSLRTDAPRNGSRSSPPAVPARGSASSPTHGSRCRRGRAPSTPSGGSPCA